jgi:hypothetical protein
VLSAFRRGAHGAFEDEYVAPEEIDDQEHDSEETEQSEPLVTHVVTQVSPMT